jgi:hypothetical protein
MFFPSVQQIPVNVEKGQIIHLDQRQDEIAPLPFGVQQNQR